MGTCSCVQMDKLITIIVLLVVFTAYQIESRAHHKVHNLALYPERHSWCQATPIRQEVAHAPECEPVTIDNVVCLGACFSYSVPRAQDYEPIAPYCDKCDKTNSSWTVVTLNCTRASTGEHYPMTRNVEMISNCSCVDCNDNSPRKKSTSSTEDRNESNEEEALGDTLEGNDLDETDSTAEVDDVNDSLDSIPTLRKLKSVSAEMHEFNKADEETAIQDNKIPSDDDHDHDSTRKERERQRALATDHDL